MDDSFSYVKERREFGRQCFLVDEDKITIDICHDPELRKNYILKNPVSESTQMSAVMAFSEAITNEVPLSKTGMNHLEGGWPKDVNPFDEEQVYRVRKRIERDNDYVNEVNELIGPMKHFLNQNNVGNIYENFFESDPTVYVRDDFTVSTGQAFFEVKLDTSPVASLSFSEDAHKIVAAYCNLQYHAPQLKPCLSKIWDLENPNVPLTSLKSEHTCCSIAFNERDAFVVAGGLLDGRVCIWDPRDGHEPKLLVHREYRHRERVNDVKWQHSKTNTELFSGGGDGQIQWWDTRKFEAPIDTLTCDPVVTDDQKVPRSQGVSVLEYEYTIPTRFMVGTEMGYVFIGNRKAKLPTEKILGKFQTNLGPIHCLERNPAFTKNLLVLGDYCVKIWNEDFKKSPIIWSDSVSAAITCGSWSSTRYSLFAVGRNDGILDFWDLTMCQKYPTTSIQASAASLTSVKSHASGKFFVCGDSKGKIQLINMSEAMTFNLRQDRAKISSMFDREAKREKLFDGRRRENVLKLNQLRGEIVEDQEKHDEVSTPTDIIATVEKDFYDIIEQEIKKSEKSYTISNGNSDETEQ